MTVQDQTKQWMDHLSEEDFAFVKRFMLASGSLKAMAKAYGVSYPTVRLRLDRLIDKIKIVESQEITTAFERRLRLKYAEGRIDMNTLKELLTAYFQDKGEES